MHYEKEPRNLARYARDHMVIGADVNKDALKPKKPVSSEKQADRMLCWTSYYAMVFAALAMFMPYETAMALEQTVDFADKVGGVMGLTDGWGIYIRGTLD